SFLKGRGSTLTVGVEASGGVTAGPGDTDLVAVLLGAVSADPTADQQRLSDLDADQRKQLVDAIKSAVDHNLRVSLNAALARIEDGQAAFRYEIRAEQLDARGRDAVNAALRGDISPIEAEGAGMPGIRPIESVFSDSLTREATLKLNLLGIFNYINIS